MAITQKYPRVFFAFILALVLLAPTLALSPAVRAADCQVTSGADSGAGTLRAAVDRTDNFSTSDCATISFASGVTEVQITSYLNIRRAVTIVGPGMDALTIRYTGEAGLLGLVIFVGDSGALDLRGVTVTGGNVNTGNLGAGIVVAGTAGMHLALTLDGVRVSGNQTTASGGGIYATNATLQITDSIIEGNTAGLEGGALYLSGLGGSASATLTNTTVTGNGAGDRGITSSGGIYIDDALTNTETLTVKNSSVSGNSGRGISTEGARGGPDIALTNSTVSGNTGAGIYLTRRGATVANSTLSDNGYGALMFALSSTTTLTNSTVSGNAGAPALAVLQGTIALTHTTVVGNTSPSGGAGIMLVQASATVRASIVAGNLVGQTASDCTLGTVDDTITSQGNNLVGPGCPADKAGDVTLTGDIATVLDPTLADNGGPTQTHNLVPGSPAIDHIDACTVSNDQRGFPRPYPVGGKCDIGAVEYTPPAPSPSPSPSSNPSPNPSPSAGPCGTRFGDVPASDPACVAIEALAARGVINGCDSSATPPLFCPNDPTLREQMAALIVRAIPDWANETGQPSFSDNTADTELMQRVATLQRHNVVRGYQDEVCVSQGKQPPCYGPLDTVKYGQVLLFIARAMVERGYWTLQPDNRTIFPDQNGAVGADPDTDQQTLDHRAVVTYIHYVGNPPDVADVHAPFQVGGVAPGGWGDDSTRAWFTRAFWPAIQNH